MLILYLPFLEIMIRFKVSNFGDFIMENYILTQALDYISRGIMIQDVNRRVVFFNHACEKITKRTKNEVVGKDCGDIFKCHTSSGLCITDKCCPGTEILNGNLSQGSRELLINRGDNRESWIRVNVSPIKDKAGKVTHIISVIEDVNETKRFSDEIIKSKALSSFGALASELAHEIKNPLNAMNVQLLLLKHEINDTYSNGGSQKNELLKIVSIVQNEINRLSNFVGECLQFAKTGELNKSHVHIHEMLTDIIALLNPQAQLNGIQLKLDVMENVPAANIDKDKIKQAILNILINGIEAMPDGGEVYINASKADDDIIITCHDTGPGIPEESRDKIFNLFYTTKDGGTGIGLSSAQNIIQMHGGTIRLAPSAVGCKFLITIPADQE
ncbi:MAG: PAS domain-containing protein [Planctomycetes bacterium]|nr:PAS domain-containing protein [Planctomycetota bacterium]